MSERWRCCVTGCNPRLTGTTALQHKAETGHRVARWPVRSAEGKRRARERNRTGYYDKYNVGAKSRNARIESGHLPEPEYLPDWGSEESHGQC